jgi:hypothetical protein
VSAFVIEYHRVSGDYRITEFGGQEGRAKAIRRRLDLERQHENGDGWEIVSLHADSVDALKTTHSRYFMGQELAAAS